MQGIAFVSVVAFLGVDSVTTSREIRQCRATSEQTLRLIQMQSHTIANSEKAMTSEVVAPQPEPQPKPQQQSPTASAGSPRVEESELGWVHRGLRIWDETWWAFAILGLVVLWGKVFLPWRERVYVDKCLKSSLPAER